MFSTVRNKKFPGVLFYTVWFYYNYARVGARSCRAFAFRVPHFWLRVPVPICFSMFQKRLKKVGELSIIKVFVKEIKTN